MLVQSYCVDFEGGCPVPYEPRSHVDENEETLAQQGDILIADHSDKGTDCRRHLIEVVREIA